MSRGHHAGIPHASIVDDCLSDTTLASDWNGSDAIVRPQCLSIANKVQVSSKPMSGWIAKTVDRLECNGRAMCVECGRHLDRGAWCTNRHSWNLKGVWLSLLQMTEQSRWEQHIQKDQVAESLQVFDFAVVWWDEHHQLGGESGGH